MNHTYLDRRLTLLRLFLSAALLAVAPVWAQEGDQAAGAQAAALENQASALEATIDQACLKAAVPARPLCHKQMGLAVARLRERAQRAN